MGKARKRVQKFKTRKNLLKTERLIKNNTNVINKIKSELEIK